jgi:hypothetical protein
MEFWEVNKRQFLAIKKKGKTNTLIIDSKPTKAKCRPARYAQHRLIHDPCPMLEVRNNAPRIRRSASRPPVDPSHIPHSQEERNGLSNSDPYVIGDGRGEREMEKLECRKVEKICAASMRGRTPQQEIRHCIGGIMYMTLSALRYRWPEDHNGQRASVKEGRRIERKKERRKEGKRMSVWMSDAPASRADLHPHLRLRPQSHRAAAFVWARWFQSGEIGIRSGRGQCEVVPVRRDRD